MSSGFTNEELLYPLTKGAQPGHPFEGNQWTKGSVGLSNRSFATLKDVRSGSDAGPASEHSHIAYEHRQMAQSIEDGMKGGKIPLSKWNEARTAIEAHKAADDAHIKASSANAKVAVQAIKPATGSTVSRNKMKSLSDAARNASASAFNASANAEIATRKMSGDNGPSEHDLNEAWGV